MVEYLPIFILFAVAFIFVFASFFGSSILGPKKPTAAKSAPYECGIVPRREVAQRFPVRFYLVAMIFIIFDIEIIFLYPWAVRFHALGGYGLVEMVAFSVPVVIALAYLISNGALDWGPGRRVEMTERERTSDATIRLVHKPATSPNTSSPQTSDSQEGAA